MGSDVYVGPFRVHRIAMKCSGVWPLHKNQRRSMAVFSITILVQIVIVVTSLLHPLKQCLPSKLRRGHSFRIPLTMIGMLSQSILRVHGRSMIPLIEETIADWFTITGSKEGDFLKRDNRVRIFFFYFLVAWGLAFDVYILKYIPFIAELIFMEKKEDCALNDDIILSNLLPILIQITEAFSKLTTITGFLLFWSLAMHLAARFKILKEQFQDLLLIKEKSVRRKEFRRLVASHNYLFDLSRSLENSFTVFVAIHVIKLQIFICMDAFTIVIIRISEVSPVSLFIGVVNITLEASLIYIYYYASDYLSASSEEIGDVFTQCNWYDLSKESIKDYSIVIARCQKPCTVTCAKMYKLNLTNLRYVFETIYSYVTCIAAVAKTTQK